MGMHLVALLGVLAAQMEPSLVGGDNGLPQWATEGGSLIASAGALPVEPLMDEGLVASDGLPSPIPPELVVAATPAPLPTLETTAPVLPPAEAPVVSPVDGTELTSSPLSSAANFPNLLQPSRWALAGMGVVGAGAFVVGASLLLLGNYLWALSTLRSSGERIPLLQASSVVTGGGGVALLALAAVCGVLALGTMVAAAYFRDFFPSEKASAAGGSS